jgi:glycosyltransferase involved in cell wall biosynthesis
VSSREVNAPGRPRRLLVITYHFPPDGAVGGLRWHGLSKYLARQGWEVHVVTAAAQSGQEASPGVHVHAVPRARTLNDRYNDWARQRRAKVPQQAEPAAKSAPPPPSTEASGWLRTNLGVALVFPDDARGWMLRAAHVARTLLREMTFDAVVTSGPPHSAHLAGALACAGTDHRPWIDMRDPWSTKMGAWSERPVQRFGLNGLIPWLERIAFARARGIVANTAEFADVLRATHPGLLVESVPNGIDVERLPAPPADRFAGLSIAYAGTLYAGRNLSTVLRAMHGFLERHPEARKGLTLRVAGTMDEGHAQRFRTEVSENGLEDVVQVLGRIPGADALQLINRSHLALVLAQDQAMQVPAKIYEGVAMGVPTLVIAEPSSAAAREARRVGAVTCGAEDHEAIVTLLEQIWSNATNRSATSASIGYQHIARHVEALLLGQRAKRVLPPVT